MTARITRVGIIGLGRIAESAHIPALLAIEGVQITAVCDIDHKALTTLAGRYGISERYVDAAEMAAASTCDCVFVLTRPHDAHASISRMMLRHGKDVLCEKPMATNLDDARQLVDLAKETSRILMIGFNRRFMPLVRQAKSLFTGRRLEVCKISHTASSRRTNTLLDNPHAIDLMRYFIDSPPRAVHAGKPGGNTVNPSVTALIEFESGAAGVLILNNDAGGVSELVELHGGGLSVFLNITDHVLRYSDRTWGDERSAPAQWSEYRGAKQARFEELHGFSDLDRHFVDCVRSRRPPAAGAADAYRSHELAHRVYSEVCPVSTG